LGRRFFFRHSSSLYLVELLRWSRLFYVDVASVLYRSVIDFFCPFPFGGLFPPPQIWRTTFTWRLGCLNFPLFFGSSPSLVLASSSLPGVRCYFFHRFLGILSPLSAPTNYPAHFARRRCTFSNRVQRSKFLLPPPASIYSLVYEKVWFAFPVRSFLFTCYFTTPPDGLSFLAEHLSRM